MSLDAGRALACGVTAGHWVVFFDTGTELATGFAAVKATVDGSCVGIALADLPAGVALLNAAQVAPDRRVGGPSNIVFP